MKGKRRNRVTAKRRNSTNRGNSRKLEPNDLGEPQERKISTRSSAGTNRANSLEKDTVDKSGFYEKGATNITESGTRRNSRNSLISTSEKNIYNNNNNNNTTITTITTAADTNNNITSNIIQTRRSVFQNIRCTKETNGDSKKMKDYVVTRSVTSKRESLKSNKNTNPEKEFIDTYTNVEPMKMESQHDINVNSNFNWYSDANLKAKDSSSNNNSAYPQNKEMGKRESKKRERKEEDTYNKTHTREKDIVKRQRRQDRKLNQVNDEIYTQNNESSVQLNKEQIDKTVERGREGRKDGRVLRGRKETQNTEKDKRGRGNYGFVQQYYSEVEKKSTNAHYTKDEKEAGKNYEHHKEMNDTYKYNGDVVTVEKEKGRDRRGEKQHNVNNNVDKITERNRRHHTKLEMEGVTKIIDKHSSPMHEGKNLRENVEEVIKRGKTVVGKEKKEMVVEGQQRVNKVEEIGKYNGEATSVEKGITKETREGKEDREKIERKTGKEIETEHKDDELLKSSYIKNGRVLRNLNRYNVSNGNTRTSTHRGTRNDKSEVSLCNIITSRRKRKNTEPHVDAPENEKNKQASKTNNNTVNNTTRRKTKKGKRNTRRRVTNTSNVATKTTTRNTTTRNVNAGTDKTNAAVSQHNDRRGNHVTSGISDVVEEHQRQRGSGAQNYPNQTGKVNVATGTDPYNQPVSHSTRFRERQTVHIEEPEQKKRKKRVTEEGSKESSKINVGENYQVQTLPTFFLCRPELVYDTYDNSDVDDYEERQCFECAGLPCHCRSGEPKLVYSPLMLERVKERCLKSRGYHKCVKNEMELSAYVQECAKLWKTNTEEWIPFSPEYAYKLLHYANYDPLKAISIMKSRDFAFRKILDPPTRKYQNKWKPKDKRDQLSKSPFPSPLTIRNYLSKRHHNSGYHLR